MTISAPTNSSCATGWRLTAPCWPTSALFSLTGAHRWGFFSTGVTLIKVFKSNFAIGTGWAFVFAAVAVFIYGFRRFLKMQGHYRALSALEEKILPEELEREFAAEAAMARDHAETPAA